MLATEMTVVPKQAPLPKLLAAPAVVNKDDDIYFIHIRMHRLRARDTTIATELDAKGGATIAYKRIGNEVYFAYAQCRIDHDVFSKRIGRTISKARLLGGRFDTIDVPQSASRSEVCRQLKKAYLEFQGAYIPEVTKYLY